MLLDEFELFLSEFLPEVLRNEPAAVVIQVFLGERYLESKEAKGAVVNVC